MHYLLQRPSHTRPPQSSRLWLALHGAAATADQSLTLFGAAARDADATLLAPQATRILGDGFAWEFARNQREIAGLLDMMCENTGSTPDGMCGFSMGCAMGLWLLAHQPARFRFFAAFSMGSPFGRWEFDDGGVPLDRLREAAATTPVFLAVDQYDPAGCAEYFDANLAQLQDLGFHVTTYTPQERQHWVTSTMLEHFEAWLRELP